MSMEMSFRMAPRMEVELKQKLSQELRLEVRQALELLLKIVQAILLRQHITWASLQSLERRVGEMDADDRRHLARQLGDQGLTFVSEIAATFEAAHRRRGDFQELHLFAAMLQRHRAAARAMQVHRAADVGIALRMVLRPPRTGGTPGTPENLAMVLTDAPQQYDGFPVWALAGGWAVELLTGVHLRMHHDIDTLVLGDRPFHLDTDVVHTEDYFGVISCDRDLVVHSCTTIVPWKYGEQDFVVLVAKPEFLFMSKFLMPPRPQDWDDVQLLVRRFARDWDLNLLRRLIRHQCCGFKGGKRLVAILRGRDPERILDALRPFHLEEANA